MIIDYRVSNDRNEWKKILNKFSEKDIYFEYDFFDLFRSESDTPFIVYMETTSGKMAYPFMLKDISYHPGFENKIAKNKYFDIASPYGYSSPIVETPDEDSRKATMKLFYKELESFCRDKNVVSEFIKFSPLLENHKYMEIVLDEVAFLKKMVVTNLQDYGDPIYGELKKRKRRDMKKCKKLGMEALFELSPESFDEQFKIYCDTMSRKGAADFFFFPKNFFEKMLETLSDNILLVSVVLDGKIIGFDLCFIYGEFIHSYLAGTANDCIKLSPNDLSNAEVIRWGHENGYRYVNAGGGLTSAEDDSLYLYKKAFAKNSDFDLFIGKKIWNRELYDYLVDISEVETDPSDSFFPVYRK